MSEGWHCLHMYYQVDAAALAGLDDDARARGRDELIRALDPGADGAPERLQVSVISGHRADLGLMLLDPDPLVIDRVKQAVRSTTFGSVLKLSLIHI